MITYACPCCGHTVTGSPYRASCPRCGGTLERERAPSAVTGTAFARSHRGTGEYECFECGARFECPSNRVCDDCGGRLHNLGVSRDL